VEDSNDIVLEKIPSTVATLQREPKRGDRVKQLPHMVNGKHARCLVSVVSNKPNPRGWYTVCGFEILREDWGKWWFLIEQV
jgi:hypothetical protein